MGKADVAGARRAKHTGGPTEVRATACLHTETPRNTGDPGRWVRDSTGRPRGTGRAAWGVGEAHSTDEAGQRRRREGASVQGQRTKRRQPEIGDEPITSTEGWEAAGDVAC